MAKEDKGYPIVKSISFTDEYRQEYLHLCSQKNASKYICDLIRRDMTLGFEEEPSTDIDSLVKKALQEHLASMVMFATPNIAQAPPMAHQKEIIDTPVDEEEDIEEEILDDYF